MNRLPTPDFEDWMNRQDIPIEERTTLEDAKRYARDEWGLKGGSLDVFEDWYGERYKMLVEYGVRPIEMERTYMGEPFKETRYVISEMRGLFSKWRAYEIAAERAEAAGDYESLDIFRFRLEEMVLAPEKRRNIWQVPRREE